MKLCLICQTRPIHNVIHNAMLFVLLLLCITDKLEVELEDFKTALSALYTDIHSQD